MQKFERISQTLHEQIEKGDFSLSKFPSERVLAESLSANRVTVQKALNLLAQNGIVHKLKNGRYAITSEPNGSTQNLRIALLVPPFFGSGNIRIWHKELLAYTSKFNLFLRPFLFVHWNDVTISETLANFDGIFIIPPDEEIPTETLLKLQATHGLVMLNTNMSHAQILSIQLFPSSCVKKALDRLHQLNHQSIACVHIQSDHSDVLNERIDQWKGWSKRHKNNAPFIQSDVNAFDEGEAFLDAQLKTGRLKNSTAVFCTTIHAATALLRACKNSGLDPEKDIAIFTLDDEGIGRHSTPTVSAFKRPDIQALLAPIFDWIKAGGDTSDWKGPLFVKPSVLEMYEGETLHSPASTKK